MNVFDDHIGQIVRAGNTYERGLLSAIAQQRPQGTAVDVGAFVGTHSAAFAAMPGIRQVVAIEPNAEACAKLRENVPSARVIQAAVHDLWCECCYVDGPPENRGMGKIVAGTGWPCLRLDDIDLQDVALLKVDVEGMEMAVLNSGRSMILRDRPLLSLEGVPTLPTWLGLHYRLLGRYCSTPTYLWRAT